MNIQWKGILAMNRVTMELPWPEWQISEKLGKGSYGEVYKVIRQENGFDSYAAVKVMRIPEGDSEIRQMEDNGISAKSYFKSIADSVVQEIMLMQKLKGASNIVSIEDYQITGEEDGVHWTIFIRMELLQDLNTYKRNHNFSVEDIIRLGKDVCTALEICHKEQIVHRDIKPSNIFISKFGDFKVGDFGISRHTDKNEAAFSTRRGTVSYMAPEVYNGGKYDYTVDIYSLGLMLYQLLNQDRLPFYPPYGQDITYGDTEVALEKRLQGEYIPDPKDGGKELGNIIRKACDIDPKKRYQSAAEMKADLERIGTLHMDEESTEKVIRYYQEEKTEVKSGNPMPGLDKTEIYKSSDYQVITKKSSPLKIIIPVAVAAVIAIVLLAVKMNTQPESPVNPKADTITINKEIKTDKYSVKVKNGRGSGKYVEGDTVSIIAEDKSSRGYTFTGWKVNSGNLNAGSLSGIEASFSMPAGDVEIEAQYQESKKETYTLKVNGGTGSGNYAEGEKITISHDNPAAGMKFLEWITEGISVNKNADTLQITMPAGNVTITAVFDNE